MRSGNHCPQRFFVSRHFAVIDEAREQTSLLVEQESADLIPHSKFHTRLSVFPRSAAYNEPVRIGERVHVKSESVGTFLDCLGATGRLDCDPVSRAPASRADLSGRQLCSQFGEQAA